MEYLNWVQYCCEFIENFSLDEQRYLRCKSSSVIGDGSVFLLDESGSNIQVNFNTSKNSKVYIGKNINGNFSISIWGDNSVIYIGDNCRLDGLRINSNQKNDLVAIGNHVTTTARNTWISGKGAGKNRPVLVIGDDCMFAYDIVIRNTDEHPIFQIEDEVQINSPSSGVIIEPHCWICEQVNILKDVYIGANSILSLGATVTNSIPSYSIAKGIPAKVSSTEKVFWARENSSWAIEKAKRYYEKYLSYKMTKNENKIDNCLTSESN